MLATRVRLGVVIFTGLVAFLPSLVSFFVASHTLTWQVLVAWAVPVALWCLAWRRPSGRILLFPASIALLLTLAVALPVPDGYTWPRVAGIALAVTVSAAAVSGIGTTAVWCCLAVALLLLDFLRDEPNGGHLSTSALDAIGTFLGLLVIPVAIAVISQHWLRSCRAYDLAMESARTGEARALAAESASAAQAAVDRRIHETVLNTLATIVRSRTSSESARQQCAADLKSLDSVDDTAPRGVRDLITVLLAQHPVPGPVQPVVSADIVFRDDEVAQITYSALGEVLRNVIRHAQATRTVIRVRAPRDRVIITVTDNGSGMDEAERRRFGMRRALAESVVSIGGAVTVESAQDRGTAVTIDIPLESPRAPEPVTAEPAIDIILGPPRVRLAMASPVLIGVCLLIPTAWSFSQPLLILPAYVLFAACVVALAVRWGSGTAAFLSWGALALLWVTQSLAWLAAQGCSSAGGIHLIVFTTAGAMGLAILAQRRLAMALIVMALTIVPGLLLPQVLPAACRPEAGVPALETSVWVVALFSIITLLSRAFDTSSAALSAQWREIAAADARMHGQAAADQRWRSVDQRTRSLLGDIASGRTSAEVPEVRAEAARLEARLRSLLETSKLSHEPLRECIEGVVEDATAAGATVIVVVVEANGSWTPPAWLGETLATVGAHTSPASVHLTVLADELLVTAPRTALIAAALSDLSDTDSEDVAVASVRADILTAAE